MSSEEKKQPSVVSQTQTRHVQATYLPQRPPTPQRTPPADVQQQQQNQVNNQVQPLKGMQPTDPPVQSSTPSNSDLKVQTTMSQQPMNIAYVPQGQLRTPGQASYYRPTPPTNQNRMANQRQVQQAIYPHQPQQFVSMSIPHTPVYINAPAVPYYNNTPRPATNFVSSSYQVIAGQHLSGYSYAAQPPTQPQPQYYYNAAMMPRPQQQVAPVPQNAAQPPPTANIPIPQPTPQHGTHTKHKRRSNLVPIIDPSTGRDRLNEMYEQEQDSSHPPSGESSARQTPQPLIPNKELQATFAKQVVQAINEDEVVVVEELNQSPIHEHVQIYPLPPQAVHPRIDIVQASKLQKDVVVNLPTNKDIAGKSLRDESKKSIKKDKIETKTSVSVNPTEEDVADSTSVIQSSIPDIYYQAVLARRMNNLATRRTVKVTKSKVKKCIVAKNANDMKVETAETQLDLLYSTNQWTPWKKDGLKVYTREFLLAMSKQQVSLKKPENLPGDILKMDQGRVDDIGRFSGGSFHMSKDFPHNVANKSYPNPPSSQSDECTPSKYDGSTVYTREFLLDMSKHQASLKKPENLPGDILKKDRRQGGDGDPVKKQQVDKIPSKNNKSRKLNSKDNSKETIDIDAYNDNIVIDNSTIVAPTSNILNNTNHSNDNFGNNSYPNCSQTDSQQSPLGSNSKAKGPNKSLDRNMVSFKNDIELNEADNARFAASGELSEEEEKTAKLYQRFSEILNDLTPHKFDSLMTQVQDLNIDTAERLQGILDLVFEKAVDEPKFGNVYSSICRELAMMQVPLNSGEGPAEFVNFRKLLVTKCQVEVEKTNVNVDEIKNCIDPVKRKVLLTELKENERQLKKKSVGTIRFIGELFKQQMLTVSIMLKYLKQLLHAEDEESLECLCKLLATVGGILDSSARQADVNMIFNGMRAIVEKRPAGISNRIRFMLQDSIELRRSSWKSGKLDSVHKKMDQIENEIDSEPEIMSIQELYKRFRGILNKLTPENFDILMTQVRSLNIDTSERLQGIIDLVFEKAVYDPLFGSAYSSLCRELAMMQVPLNSDEGPEEFVNFRKLLVTRCQVEFEKSNANEKLKTSKVYEIENCPDPDKRKELQTELEENERQLRRKSVGTIRFIGELFKQQMLTVSIMLRCLKELLQAKDEESLECLCKLLATVGEILDNTKQTDLNMIFNEMRDIVEKRPAGISSRIRFMLQDSIELRLSSWVPRRLGSVLKKMDQLEKEVDNEQMMSMQTNSTPMSSKKDNRDSNNKNNTVQSDKLKSKAPSKAEHLASQHKFSNWSMGSEPIVSSDSHQRKELLTELDENDLQVRRKSIETSGFVELPMCESTEPMDFVQTDRTQSSFSKTTPLKEFEVPNNFKNRTDGGNEDVSSFKASFDTPSPRTERQYSESVENTRRILIHCNDKEQLINIALECMQAEIDRIKTNERKKYLKKVSEILNNQISETNKKQEHSSEPLGSQHTFSNWSMGSKPINKGGPVAPAPAPVLVNANAFNVLNTIGEYDSSKHPSSMNMRSNKAYNSKGSSLERSYNRPAYDDVGGVKSGSQHRSRDNASSSYQHQRNAPQPSKMQSDYTKRPKVPFVQKSVVFAESTGAESVPSQQSMPEPTLAKAASADTGPENVTLDASHYEETFKKALETYTISCSLVECEKQIKTIPTSLLPQLIEDALLSVLERSKNARLKCGKLYSILIGNGTVLRKDFCERLKSVISEAKDFMIDIPTVWELLAELVAPLVFENCITLNDLSALLDEESKNRFGSKLLASICRTIIDENDDEKEHAVIGPLLRDSCTKLSNFMPESQIDKFIEENKFHFLNAPRPRISVDLLKRLSKMFADNTPFEEITMWISKNVSDNAVQEYQFIRTLATAIFEFSIVNEKLKAEVLAEKYCYFLRYVDNNPNLELQCLFALQSLINKLEHPQGLLLNICNKLYEDTVFSLESFLAWETNNDPLEQEGKGVTLKQLTAFFVDLKDNEYSSASEDA